MCACEAAWVWLEDCRVGPLSVLPWPYQIWADEAWPNGTKEALRTRLGWWDVGPSSGRLLHPRGMCWKSCCHQSLPKSFPAAGTPLRWAAEPVLPPLALSLLWDVLHQHFSPGLHLCSFYGVQCFSSPTPISPPGTFKPQSPGS